MGTTLQEFSKEITTIVNEAGKSIVAVDGRSGHTSSGIIWRGDYVLTAAHSIRNDSGVRVIPAPGESVEARLVGADRGTDIAVLKLDKDVKAVPVDFGSPSSLAVGVAC